MNNTLGKHLLIDFYNCKAVFHDASELQPIVEQAFALVQTDIKGIHFYQQDDELTCIAVAVNSHVCIHVYPKLSYGAVDIYSFDSDVQPGKMMSSLKKNLQSDLIKATSVRRGDFGSLRDLRPKRKSKVTTMRRMKNTGAQLKKTSTRVFNIIRHPNRARRQKQNEK